MIFTDIDKQTMQALCTLAKLAEPIEAKKAELVNVGQHLGVPKEHTLELLDEWEEQDVMNFKSEEEKRSFVNYCFSYMETNYHPNKSEMDLYNQVVENLGLESRSNN